MTSLNRRNFLKTSAAGVSSLMVTSGEALATATRAVARPAWPQRYGTAKGRTAFQTVWKDRAEYLFRHEEHPTFHRLRTTLDAYYSRSEQPIVPLREGPVRLVVKLLCEAEAGRTLFTLGLKSKSHGCWAFSIGANPSWGIGFGDLGWQIMVNAANPWKERVSLAGFDNRDWHTFELVIPQAQGPARLYCDGQFVMELIEPITDARREQERADEWERHGSIQQPVPETPGEGEYIFIESRHANQIIDVDRIEVTQRPLSTRRRTLAVVLDRDWELEATRLVENTLVRFEGNPILKKEDVPDPSGEGHWVSFPSVIKDKTGFHMYLNGVNEQSKTEGRLTCAIYHAFSTDGVHWEVTPKEPVIRPGGPGTWDTGSTGQIAVMKEEGIYRMWYGGYQSRLQQGRAGYAESRHGVHWTKPNLGWVTYGGKPSNISLSLQPDLHSNEYELPCCVVRDEDGPPDRRYVMFLHTQGPHGFIADVATSPDGKRFTRVYHNSRYFAFDQTPRNTTLHGAALVIREPNYWWAFAGHHEPGEGGYRFRFTGWVVEPGEKENISFGLWRSQRTHLQEDLQPWEKDEGKTSGLPIMMTSTLVVGDEWWVYYVCDNNVGFAKVGRDRMYGISLQPGVEHGQVTTLALEPPPTGWDPCHLTLNATGFGVGSKIEAELLDGLNQRVIEGYGSADSVAAEKDGFEIPLQWRGKGRALPSTRQPLRVRFKLTRGSGNPQVHAVYVRKR